MKLISRSEFLKMPIGTLFSRFEPDIFEGLNIKGETWKPDEGYSGDWLYQNITDAIMSADYPDFSMACDALVNGKSVEVNLECQSRDGMFDLDDKFVIWEKKDVEALIERLNRALKEGYGPS